MALCGDTVSDSIRTQSDEIMQKTFTNDLGYRQCKLYSRTMEYLEDVEISILKSIQSTKTRLSIWLSSDLAISLKRNI